MQFKGLSRALCVVIVFCLFLPTQRTAHAVQEGGASIGDPYMPELGNTGYDVQHYDLSLKFDFEAHTLDAETVITALSTLDSLGSLSLDFASLTVRGVQVDGQTATFKQDANRFKLFVTLPKPAALGQKFTMNIKYDGTPGTFQSQYLRFLPIGLDVNWETRHVFAVNEPDGARGWFPCNDHPRDRATFTYHITVPDDLTAVANGTQQGDPITAGDGYHTFDWDMPDMMATYLTVVAIKNYVAKPLPNAGLDIPLTVYAYAEDAAAAANVLQATGEIMTREIGWFGPFPFKSYGQVLVGQDAVGMEAQTMTVLPDSFARSDSNKVYTFVAHEMAHHWFGDLIALDTWADIWLNEGFASYAEYLAFEAKSGAQNAKRLLDSWEMRVRASTGRAPIIKPQVGDMFGANTYVKAGFTLHMLRLEVGDEAFFNILKGYVKRFSGKNARTTDFEAIATEISGRDLSGFFDTWLRRTDLPTAKITYTQSNGEVQALICQTTRQPFTIPLTIQFNSEKDRVGKTDTEVLNLAQAEQRATFKPGFSVQSWSIDPENRILAAVTVTEAEALPARCAA